MQCGDLFVPIAEIHSSIIFASFQRIFLSTKMHMYCSLISLSEDLTFTSGPGLGFLQVWLEIFL